MAKQPSPGSEQDLQESTLTFKLDSRVDSVQTIAPSEIAKQPFMALGKFHGLNRDLSRLSIGDQVTRFRIPDRFAYMFRVRARGKLPFTPANVAAMKALGNSMLDVTLTNDSADPKVNDSTIDSGYVYFGQFVDHDITRDNSLPPDAPQDARKIPNVVTPNLDLDSVYGRGPALDAFLYDGIKMILPPAQTGMSGPAPFDKVDNTGMVTDLPRAPLGPVSNNRNPLIGDDRNDENLIVQHLHLGFLAFHNAVIDALKAKEPALPNAEIFIKAQREVRRHYQWVLLHDFLRTMCGSPTVDDVLKHGVKFFANRLNPFTGQPPMPVEFSVACYRFGHSMIRDRYNFNDNFKPDGPNPALSNFSFAFRFTGQSVQAGTPAGAGTPAHAGWRINWNRFFSSPGHEAQNKARKIDTRVALHMGKLPVAADAANANFMAVLSARNLVRALAYGVPTGQAVAGLMGANPLTVVQLKSNPFEGPTPPTPEQQALHQGTLDVLGANNDQLCKSTPLWYYILKEAEVLAKGNHLGPVGGRIVTEVFVRLLQENPDSILNNPKWKPSFGPDASGNFRIFDLLKFAGRIPAQDPL
ncbi:heme peroxidase family protein [Hymenobacter sp.]|uniref:peroxidase family protein n=1 Tax=Hymenobacter sp. TaxID=1898978 RepID=UPI00286A5E5C|nr:heme peroxidase family protein [Hymenobacter sp.]